jgi:transposase
MAGRTCRCRACHYRTHRAGVGAVNILNQGTHGEIRRRECLVPPTDHVSPSRPVQKGVKV